MVPNLVGPSVRRPRLMWALAVPVVLVVVAGGCSHRRSAMRPVYLSPAPAVIGSPSSVSTAPLDSATTPASGGEPSLLEPLPAPEPAPAAPLTISPAPSGDTGKAVPRLDSPPAATAPQVPGEEPPLLEPATPNESSKVAPGKTGANGSSARPPAGRSALDYPPTSTKSRRTAPANGRVRQASLRENLRPYVNDPDDLFAPPKADRPWKYIVLHHSASETGGYGSIDREHRKRLGWDGCGYHFVIGNGSETPDGQIEVAQRWTYQKHGVHCRDGKSPDVNEYGIGICFVGDFENAPPTPRQVAAAKALVAYLSDRYSIAPDHTETHAHLAASPTSCPGRMFPTASVLNDDSAALKVR
ncbi:MAG: N-acetylmuramoyl-L-alanine amidase [Isosphaeraceae bacterium]